MELLNANRKYSDEEKQQLIANLDIEVEHRTRQFQSWLADGLENFNIHQEGHVSRIPKQVRNMTMRELGEKYQGNVQAALRGFQKERIVGDGMIGETDKSTRKRKWVASQEVDGEASSSGVITEHDSSRASKNARLMVATPKKKPGSSTGPGTAQHARLLAMGSKTPGNSRTMGRIPTSPSPQKSKPPFSTTAFPRMPTSRPTSPLKPSSSKPLPHNARATRPPSIATFNPTLPPKTPAYPGTAMRLPRRDESMLSVNGSPLANPYELGLGWFKGIEAGEGDGVESGDDRMGLGQGRMNGGGPERMLKRSNSIVIRRDPSFAPSINGNGGSKFHSRTNSQASIFTSSSQTQSSTHSRTNSPPIQQDYSQQTQPSSFPSYSQPDPTHLHPDATPKPMYPSRSHSHFASALVAIPTKDGHLLEFDPLQTSPGALDALEGITDSAKKQARQEMGRLVQAAVDKWKIG